MRPYNLRVDLTPDILKRPAAEGARLIALGFLAQARKGAGQLARGDGPEDLHDFRVAVRRLRSTLRAWKRELRGTIKKKHHRALREVQVSTGGGRDFEVAAEWIGEQLQEASTSEREGKAWLADSFKARHTAAMLEVRERALTGFASIARTLRKRLRKSLAAGAPGAPVSFAERLTHLLREHMDEVVLHLAHIESIEDVEEAHAARICVKRLRYLVEPMEAVLPETAAFLALCKRLQDILGDLNDARVLDAELALTEAP